jgi:hypothetical protein
MLFEREVACVDPQPPEQLSIATEQFFNGSEQKRLPEPSGARQETTFGEFDHIINIFGLVGVYTIFPYDFAKCQIAEPDNLLFHAHFTILLILMYSQTATIP